jgi:hypothetical protein
MTTVVTPEMLIGLAENLVTTVVVGYQVVATTVNVIKFVRDKTRVGISKFRSSGINKPVVKSQVLSHINKPVSEDKESIPSTPKRGRAPRVPAQKKSLVTLTRKR